MAPSSNSARARSRSPASKKSSRGNVYLFIPNIIGYFRIIAAFLAFHYATTDFLLALSLYGVSQLLDAFDGWAARIFNQSSEFGAVLDMVGLMLVLGSYGIRIIVFCGGCVGDEEDVC